MILLKISLDILDRSFYIRLNTDSQKIREYLHKWTFLHHNCADFDSDLLRCLVLAILLCQDFRNEEPNDEWLSKASSDEEAEPNTVTIRGSEVTRGTLKGVLETPRGLTTSNENQPTEQSKRSIEDIQRSDIYAPSTAASAASNKTIRKYCK